MNLTPKLLNSLTQFVTDSPEALEPKDLIALYQQLAGIKNLADVLKGYIIAYLQEGNNIEGYKLVRTKGRAGYKDSEEVVRRVIEYALKNPDRTEVHTLIKPVGINDMRKTLGPEVVADLLGDLIVSSLESKTLDFAPIIDERPEVKL